MRRGFTLVELLVATGIFVLGFSVCLGLFLAGMRARTAAEDHLRLGLAASSLVEELGLDGRGLPAGDLKPSAYIGWGGLKLEDISQPTNDNNKPLYALPHHPGVWYRVTKCEPAVLRTVNPTGYDPLTDTTASTLLARMVLVSWSGAGSTSTTLTYEDLYRHIHPKDLVITGSTMTDAQRSQFEAYLASRNLALLSQIVFARKMP